MPKRDPMTGMTIRPVGPMEVRSESNPNETYLVTLPHCSCKDFRFRDNADEPHLCKHILGLYAALHGWRMPTEPVHISIEEAAAVLAQIPSDQLADLITKACK